VSVFLEPTKLDRTAKYRSYDVSEAKSDLSIPQIEAHLESTYLEFLAAASVLVAEKQSVSEIEPVMEEMSRLGRKIELLRCAINVMLDMSYRDVIIKHQRYNGGGGGFGGGGASGNW